jgi:DNA-binding CsgD family transcriptional regulator
LPLGVIPRQQAAAIFVLDPENQPEPNDEVLVRLFGLTPAEARLAILLIHGKSLTQAAEEFGLSRNTIRSQLQKVFYKTGTTRQGELVSLLWNSLARLRTK